MDVWPAPAVWWTRRSQLQANRAPARTSKHEIALIELGGSGSGRRAGRQPERGSRCLTAPRTAKFVGQVIAARQLVAEIVAKCLVVFKAQGCRKKLQRFGEIGLGLDVGSDGVGLEFTSRIRAEALGKPLAPTGRSCSATGTIGRRIADADRCRPRCGSSARHRRTGRWQRIPP